MDIGTSIAVSVGIVTLGGCGISGVRALCNGKNGTCGMHGNMMNAIMSICAYVSDRATQEGRDLNKEVRDLMMPTINKEK